MEQSERLTSQATEAFPSKSVADSTAVKSLHSEEMTVPKFYAGKKILLTGATGFMGKVLIEKLLRCCPDVGCIYCLIRPKNKQDIAQRISDLTNWKLFDKLRAEQPDFEQKLVAVGGDMMEPDLGISEEDRHMLEQNVQIVFHSAATIKFDEPLRTAMTMNLLAVRKMIKLSRNFKHLEAFVHVSTAFANCDFSHIEEAVYKPSVDPQRIIEALEWMDDDMVEVLTKKLLRRKPNTYVYTKQLAEWLLVTEGAGLPLAIVRPSIVGATWKDPFPGWIDNYNGPSGLTIAFGKGILRSMKGEAKAVADIVPVDLPINVMITVAWYTAVARPRQVMVYHSTTGAHNPFTWGEMETAVIDSFKRTPLDACFRRPKSMVITSNSYVHDCLLYVSHLLPAHLMDLGFRVMGKKPRMVRIYQKLHKALDTLSFFTSNSWTWDNNNMDMLRHHLSPEDAKVTLINLMATLVVLITLIHYVTFYTDPRPLHWQTYMDNYCLGTKKYLLNEDLASLPAAKAHLKRLRNIRYMFNTVLAVALWRTLIARSEFARNLWYFIVKLAFKFVSYFRITSTM